MTERKTRSEWHEEIITEFLKSNSSITALLLYGSEIKRLEKKYPIVITKNAKRGNMYECLTFKRK